MPQVRAAIFIVSIWLTYVIIFTVLVYLVEYPAHSTSHVYCNMHTHTQHTISSYVDNTWMFPCRSRSSSSERHHHCKSHSRSYSRSEFSYNRSHQFHDPELGVCAVLFKWSHSSKGFINVALPGQCLLHAKIKITRTSKIKITHTLKVKITHTSQIKITFTLSIKVTQMKIQF